MKLSSAERTLLETMLPVLERPVRNCQLAHEDYERDEKGQPVLLEIKTNEQVLVDQRYLLTLKDQCSNKHFGCFHEFELKLLQYKKLAELADGLAPENSTVIQDELQELIGVLGTQDKAFNVARMPNGMDMPIFISPEETHKNVEALMPAYHENRKRCEALRLKILERVKALLSLEANS